MAEENRQSNTQPVPTEQPDVSEIIRKGNEIYASLKSELEQPTQNGKYVVIEIKSRRYFIGDTRTDAVVEAKKVFPNVVMFVRRIGGVEKVARHYVHLSRKYARIF